MNQPLLISTGEPAGIGPDICIKAAMQQGNLVFAGDKNLMFERAKMLNIDIEILSYCFGKPSKPGQMMVYHIGCEERVLPGKLNPKNAKSTLKILEWSCLQVLAGQFSALVTAPVHKAQLQHANPNFLGHTEFFQQICQAPQVVMMLADEYFRVALITTHLPIRKVAQNITSKRIESVVQVLNHDLQKYFGIKIPKIAIAGLNPHAGENGILGDEEIEIISPSILKLRNSGIDIQGPFSADTMFLKRHYDVFVAMYHDQGLCVLKYATFGKAANITLGLPIIRTSVDHGTALEIAGSGGARPDSLLTAIHIAKEMIQKRER